jgi:hypothetical protein
MLVRVLVRLDLREESVSIGFGVTAISPGLARRYCLRPVIGSLPANTRARNPVRNGSIDPCATS